MASASADAEEDDDEDFAGAFNDDDAEVEEGFDGFASANPFRATIKQSEIKGASIESENRESLIIPRKTLVAATMAWGEGMAGEMDRGLDDEREVEESEE